MHRRFLVFIILAGMASLIAFLIVMMRLDPCRIPGEFGCEHLSRLSLSLFFVSLFFTLTALFSLLGYLLRRLLQDEFTFDQMSVSLRQGLFLAFLGVGSLGLLALDTLTWWSGFLFLAFVLLIEMYFLARA